MIFPVTQCHVFIHAGFFSLYVLEKSVLQFTVLYCFFFFLVEEDYEQAIAFYTKAIEANPTVAAYYGNRSFAYLRTECFGYALADADKALSLDKGYIKV